MRSCPRTLLFRALHSGLREHLLNWAHSCNMTPGSNPTTRLQAYLQLAQFDIQSRNLFYPAPYIHAPSTVSVRALLRLRTQASPHIPAHCKLSKPTAGPATYSAFQERPCPACPLAVGDSSHYLLTCTLTHSAAADAHRPITTLLHHLRLPKYNLMGIYVYCISPTSMTTWPRWSLCHHGRRLVGVVRGPWGVGIG